MCVILVIDMCVVFVCVCVYVEHYFFYGGYVSFIIFFTSKYTVWAGVAETEVNRVCFVSFPAS